MMGAKAKRWSALLASLFAGACLAAFPWPGLGGPARAAGKQDSAFTIGSYPVEARASDAVTAKQRAIADAQQAAFRSLLRRIVPVTAYNRLSSLRSVKANELIDGFTVRSERNSQTEYIASYDFNFQAEAVRRVLDRAGIPFLDRQAPGIVVVPIYRAPPAGAPDVFTAVRGSDSWLYAWRGLDLVNALAPVDLQTLKSSVQPQAVKALAEGDLSVISTIAREYQKEAVVLAVLEPDLPQKRIKVTVAGRDAVAPFILHRTYRLDGPDLAYTAELAAVRALGVLEGRWKAINVRQTSFARQDAAPGAQSSPYGAGNGGAGASPLPGQASASSDPVRFSVKFDSMAEWQTISRQLSQTAQVSDLDVVGLSARGARVSLRYPGGSAALGVALSQHGMILSQESGGLVLRMR